ncbi:MAG TPA: ATP-binding protein [Ideonella sp.]|nr:ATP-binding protein [Ideonella sp.]
MLFEAPQLPAADAVWAEAHAALLDQVQRGEPAHALQRLARSIAHLLDARCRIVAQLGARQQCVFEGGVDPGDEAALAEPPQVRWQLRLSHAGQAVGELELLLPELGFAREALTQRIEPLLNTASALVAALLEQRGHAPPASLSVARAAMREAGTYVWEWDIASDALGDIDEGALMLGYAPHQIGHTQSDWNRLIHPDDIDGVEAAYEAHAEGRSELYRSVYRARAADGQWRWIEERGRIVERDANGRPQRMYGTQTDATVQHALEQARQDQLAAEAASAAKTEFLSRVSHELRTPLNAVLGFAQLLDVDTSGNPLDDAQRRRITLIRQAGEYLLAMIGDLLDLSLVESGRLQMQIEPVRLAPLAADCLDLVRGQAQAAGVQLRLEPVDTALWVRADAMRLKQVLINLLTNGIKYNRPGGEVTLATSQLGSGHGRIDVSDTGIGIPAEQHAGLFQPFNRLGRESGKVQGSGLGLALSQALVTVMGGQLSVSSSPAGSCFGVVLPVG